MINNATRSKGFELSISYGQANTPPIVLHCKGRVIPDGETFEGEEVHDRKK